MLFKNLLLTLLIFSSLLNKVQAFPAHCTCLKNMKNNEWLVGDEDKGAQFLLNLNGKDDITTDIPLYEGKLSGSFVKIMSDGSYMFNSDGLTEFADQSDFGYIFASEDLLTTGNGNLTFSVRQLGDSDGSWWLKQYFECHVILRK